MTGDVPQDGKVCSVCAVRKPLADFNKNKSKPMGVVQYCRACESERRYQKAPDLDVRPVLIPEQPLEPILFVPDVHVPNHDEKAWGVMLRVGLALKPRHIVVLGDFADGETLSAHPATKPGEQDFGVEVEAVKGCLDQLDALGAENKIYIEGNHEFRLDRYLMERAPNLFRCISWQSTLELYRRNWAWIPYRKSTKIGKLHLTHDTGQAGMNAHRTSAVAFGGSVVIGHTHRMSYEVRGRFDGTPYLAAMFGWLGDAEKAAAYMHEAKASDWVKGFGVGYLEPASGIVHVQPVPIVNGRCVVQGRLFA